MKLRSIKVHMFGPKFDFDFEQWYENNYRSPVWQRNMMKFLAFDSVLKNEIEDYFKVHFKAKIL